MTYHKYNPVFNLILLLILFTLNQCSDNEPTQIGLNFQDNKSESNIVRVRDSTQILTRTVEGWGISSVNQDKNVLGSYYDPVFGLVNASIMTEIRQLTSKPFEEISSIDSVVFRIKLDKVFDAFASFQEVILFELTQHLQDTANYYSDLDHQLFHDTDTLSRYKINYTDTSEMVSIKLDNKIAERILMADSATLSSISAFTEFFNGFYITCKAVNNQNRDTSSGNLAQLNLTSEETEFVIHYNDTVAVFIVEGISNVRVNLFDHEYEQSSVGESLTSPEDDSIMYIENLGGVNTKLELPVLKALKDSFPSSSVSLARVELKLFPSTSSYELIGEENFPNLMIIEAPYTDKRNYQLVNRYNDTYKEADDYYLFDITGAVQGYLMGSDEMNLYLQGSLNSNATNYQRVILNGVNSNKPPQLSITYLKY